MTIFAIYLFSMSNALALASSGDFRLTYNQNLCAMPAQMARHIRYTLKGDRFGARHLGSPISAARLPYLVYPPGRSMPRIKRQRCLLSGGPCFAGAYNAVIAFLCRGIYNSVLFRSSAIVIILQFRKRGARGCCVLLPRMFV